MKPVFSLVLVSFILMISSNARVWGQSPYDLAKRQARYGQLVGPAVPPPGYRGSSYNERRSVIGPLGGASYSANRGGAYVAPDGSTVEYASQSDAVRGPFGAGLGTRTSETKVTAASGNAYVWSGSTQSAAVGPPVGAIRGYRSTAAAISPYGGVAVRRRGMFLRP